MAKILPISKGLAKAGLIISLLAAPLPALAQTNLEEARLRKIEAEIRALQRKVFPGGDARYFEPEIAPGERQPATNNAPSTNAVTDILIRLDAIEMQLQRLTARSEENSNAISLLDARIATLEEMARQRAAAARVEQAIEPSAAQANLAVMSDGASQAAGQSGQSSAPSGGAPAEVQIRTAQGNEGAASANPAGPSDDRLAGVQAIEKPQTDDAGADEYTYGFRLWNAGFYPEARQQLGIFLDEYPNHELVSYGRNLLGRAYLDDGMAEEAARWFLRNYQADKQGRRAGDSLLFLAESMIALGDTNRACIALAEFGETYPALAAGRLQDQYEANRRKVTCG